MLRSLRNAVFQTLRNKNGGRGGGGDHSTTHFLHIFLLQNPFPRSISSSSIGISSTKNHTSFVVSYLINSCGFSEDKAISASKKIHFETSTRPDSVLTLLENNGFTKPYISKLITKHPPLLLADPNKTLKPKLQFFNSIEFSGLELAEVLSRNPNILLRSLEKHIIPYFAFLKSILHTNKNVITCLKRCPWLFNPDPQKALVPNMVVLRDRGVPESNIAMLLQSQPRTFLINSDRMKEIVKEIMGMNFDPLQSTCVSALHSLASMSKSTWEAKLNVFRRWGWSEVEIQTAFRKQPRCMTVSEKKIMAIMDFLVNQIGFNSPLISDYPNVLLFSLEKRII